MPIFSFLNSLLSRCRMRGNIGSFAFVVDLVSVVAFVLVDLISVSLVLVDLVFWFDILVPILRRQWCPFSLAILSPLA
jgi:hypothetical protein